MRRLLLAPAIAAAAHGHHGGPVHVRFATFNASLNRATEGQPLKDLSTPDNRQATRSSTPATSPTPRPATCALITCCRRGAPSPCTPRCLAPLARLNDASDHHLVRVDVLIP
jgi:hypothetical protein